MVNPRGAHVNSPRRLGTRKNEFDVIRRYFLRLALVCHLANFGTAQKKPDAAYTQELGAARGRRPL